MILTCEYSRSASFVSALMQNYSKLQRLAKRWEPRLSKKPGMRYIVLRLITASNDRDTLQGFVTETDQAINEFLVSFGLVSDAYTQRKTNAHYFLKSYTLKLKAGWVIHAFLTFTNTELVGIISDRNVQRDREK